MGNQEDGFDRLVKRSLRAVDADPEEIEKEDATLARVHYRLFGFCRRVRELVH